MERPRPVWTCSRCRSVVPGRVGRRVRRCPRSGLVRFHCTEQVRSLVLVVVQVKSATVSARSRCSELAVLRVTGQREGVGGRLGLEPAMRRLARRLALFRRFCTSELLPIAVPWICRKSCFLTMGSENLCYVRCANRNEPPVYLDDGCPTECCRVSRRAHGCE